MTTLSGLSMHEMRSPVFFTMKATRSISRRLSVRPQAAAFVVALPADQTSTFSASAASSDWARDASWPQSELVPGAHRLLSPFARLLVAVNERQFAPAP